MLRSRLTLNKKLLVIAAIALAIFLGLQFSSPKIENKPPEGEIDVPLEVKNILQRSCYDCHSNQSNPKWYDRIAPASHLVAHDVNEARSRFNFSEWSKLPSPLQQVLLWEMVNAIEQKKMPLNRYRMVHPEAAGSPSELAVLKRYVNTLPGRTKVDTAKIIKTLGSSAANTPGGNRHPISLTGIPYSDDYKTWKVLSVTDKFDGGSMRVVYANDIMMKAIQSKEIPFPDGARMVKAVWGKQIEDKEGNIFPGNFQNVQFMVKDSKKYASTEGWGFAKFDGLELNPFGKSASFAKTCIACHKLLVPENDFVFNIPTK
ncbi:cytochrome P460 family protein [Desertivirga brevis]|uniref:cytochrome P460 family protein n=1 Tax=Desertivirga brevis TaxID=2810310 RepID=UPI001A96C716|nr:cytochrome P460 family protein [Pedobacter sp. SYSU D00873]